MAMRPPKSVASSAGTAGRAPPVPHALGFTSLEREVADLPLVVEGHLPGWLTGRLIRTGPARFEVGPDAYVHWFDGLAMLHAFAFDPGGVRYSNRFLRSRAFEEAMATGRISRGEFMTDPCLSLFGRVTALFDRRLTDNANVAVATLGGALVALTETTLPIRFDPVTLETLGPLASDPAVGGQVSTAHPHDDGARSYSYVIVMGRRSLYRLFVDEGGARRVLTEIPVDRPSYMHSFGMSERFLVLTEFPLCVNPLRLALSNEPFISSYRWLPQRGTRFTVIDKESGAVLARARTAPCFAFHHVNAFEEGGAVVVDLLASADASLIGRLRLDRLRAGMPARIGSTLTRFRVPLSVPGDEAYIEGEALCDAAFELPRIDYARRAGRPYAVVWGVGESEGAAFLDTVVKVELDRADAVRVRRWSEAGAFPGEPVFVARPEGEAEDDGVLLSVVLDSHAGASFLLVLDAATLEEVARARVPHHVPFGFHGVHLRNFEKM